MAPSLILLKKRVLQFLMRCLGFDNITNYGLSPEQLPDVVGELTKIQGSNLEDLSCEEKITLYQLLADGKNVRVMVWDVCALEFRKLYATIAGKSTILIITAVNPKSYG
ncbi:unnamed protein product, partial [Arabidopsis halleri]